MAWGKGKGVKRVTEGRGVSLFRRQFSTGFDGVIHRVSVDNSADFAFFEKN